MERCRVTEELNEYQRDLDSRFDESENMELIERKVAELKRDNAAWLQVMDIVINDDNFLNTFKGLNEPTPSSPAFHYSVQNLHLLTELAFKAIAEDLI
mgnify:CR=1 FL=1